MISAQIKSKKRVKDHGEVFTPDFIVDDMLDLVKEETERIDSRFLEPACGDGNFLAPVLQRKLAIVSKRYSKSQIDYEKHALQAVSSIYGIELLADNTDKCRLRLLRIVANIYKRKYRTKVKEGFLKSVEFVLKKNILQGNALTLKTNDEKEYIIFAEWAFLSRGMVKRRDFVFREMGDFDPNAMLYHAKREISDTGEDVFSPFPIRDYYPLKHYLSLDYEDNE
jgi:hypothetical protein